MIIHTADSRRETVWTKRNVTFGKLAEMASKPKVTDETAEEFAAMPKARQDELKDVGGFVLAELRNGRRGLKDVLKRTGAALDADSIEGPEGLERLESSLEYLAGACGFEYCFYSTRKSSKQTPRVRVLIPFSKAVSPAEGEACSLKLCEMLGMEMFDPTTCEPNRLMYWPSVSRDGLESFIYRRGGIEGEALDVGVFLNAFFDDWRDRSEWPVFPGAAAKPPRTAEVQADPLNKKGIVGQFCRAHTIEDAIAEFIPDVYVPAGGGRYTHVGSTTTGGAVVYDGKFIYSHHATDPACGRLMNAYDMVRLHKFGDKKGSETKMQKFAASDPKTIEEAKRDQRAEIERDFNGIKDRDTGESGGGLDYLDRLDRNPKNPGQALCTRHNAYEIFANDPRLKGKYHLDEFTGIMTIDEEMPWAEPKKVYPREWTKFDNAGAYMFFEKEYHMTNKTVIDDGIAQAFCANRVHPLKDYLDSLKWDGKERLETLFTDYLGAEDTEYNRAVAKKCLTAAVARVYEPGRKFDTMTILCGPQGAGKSKLLSVLGGDWYSDSLAEFSGKDAFMEVEASWIMEIAELEGFNAYEMRTIKRFLSKQADSYRAPYESQVSNHKRHSVFFGTTNDAAFLRDKTGNRRFWPVTLGEKDPELVAKVFNELPAERDQIWAEAKAAYQAGESLILNAELEAVAETERELRMEDDPLEGKIVNFILSPILKGWAKIPVDERILFRDQPEAKMFDGRPTARRDKICAAEIFSELFREPPGRMDKRRVAEINRILSNIPGLEKMETPRRFGADYGSQRGYYITEEFYDLYGDKDN